MDAPRLVRSEGNCLATGGIVSGVLFIVCGLFFWPALIIGLLLFIVGIISGRTSHVCGACGNEVAQTSQLCPTCRARLHEHHVSPMRLMVILAWIVLIIALIIGTIWLIQNQPVGH